MQAPALSALLSNPSTASSIAVIDVRDSDHIGGHIRNSMHVPTSDLDFRIPELVRLLQDKDTVVFHCMLSQQRGPRAALRYARERIRMLGEQQGASRIEDVPSQQVIGEVGNVQGEQNDEQEQQKPVQKIAVLERGFEGWQQLYGRDEKLTEAYAADIWEMGD